MTKLPKNVLYSNFVWKIPSSPKEVEKLHNALLPIVSIALIIKFKITVRDFFYSKLFFTLNFTYHT